MKSILVSLVLWSLAVGAGAGTFSGNGGQGVSTVGSAPGDDYPTLAAAAADFSGRAGGCTGDWTVLLTTSTLVEPANVAFGNATNGFHVTVKPAPGIDAQILFTAATANPGAPATAWSGNWIIGIPAIGGAMDTLTATDNFTIDGSNNGTTSRNLTITNSPVDAESQLIRVVGACANTTIKNVNLTSNALNTPLNFPIEFTARKTAADLDFAPNGCHVDNCDITTQTGGNSQNVLFRQVSASGKSLTPGTAIDNVTVTSNTITGIYVAVNLGLVANATVSDNRIRMACISNSYQPNGIQHNKSNGTTGWTVNIHGNKFLLWDNVSTSNNRGLGAQVQLDPATASPLTGTYNVYNNFFAGFQYTNTQPIASGGSYRAVVLNCSVAQTDAVARIYHNSFYMPNLPSITAPNACASYHALGINTTNVAYGFHGSMDVKNNIFVMEQNNAVVFFRTSTLAGPGLLTSDYNTFHVGSTGAKIGCYVNSAANQTANYAALWEWQVAGYDTHSEFADPRVPPPPPLGPTRARGLTGVSKATVAPGMGIWVSNTDLHFNGSTILGAYQGIDVGIATDIDGETRTAPVKGADEVPLVQISGARHWESYR